MMLLDRLFCAAIFMATGVYCTSKIEPSLQQYFTSENTNTRVTPISVMVTFSNRVGTVIDEVNRQKFRDIAEKRAVLREALIEFSNKEQRDVQDFLTLNKVSYETLWITNRMHIPRADYSLVKTLANFHNVVRIEKEKFDNISISLNASASSPLDHTFFNSNSLEKQWIDSWGIRKIRADQVWKDYTGRGVVVANIDTGVQVSHLVLESNWRKEYGWYDPYFKTEAPIDEDGHGTNTMSVLAGRFGIGVAPDVAFISCRGCYNCKCSEAALIKCGQWMLCPTLPNGKSSNCSMAPKIVSNSWGGLRTYYEDWYDDVIDSWHAAEIIPVFGIGNGGPNCHTSWTPGDRPNTIGVANTDKDDRIEMSSSRGPKYGRIPVDIAAPGTAIIAAGHEALDQFVLNTGTSMACPFVSGVVALMLEKNPWLNYQQIYKAITSTAEKRYINFNDVESCGGVPPNQFPNNVFGYGRIDAINAVNAV